MNQTLDAVLNSKGISPVVEFWVSQSSSLTKVPDQISKFNAVQRIGLSSNQITSIPSGALSSSAPSFYIQLWPNQITVISSKSFNFPNAISVTIYLSVNRITSIPSGAFSYPSGTKADIWLSSNQIISISPDAFSGMNQLISFASFL